MESEEISSSETSSPEAKNNDLSDFPFDGESTAPLFNKRLHLIPKYVIGRPILEDPPVFIAYEKPSDYAAAWDAAEPSTSKVYEGEPEPKRIVRRRFSINTETVKSTSEKISSDNDSSSSETSTPEAKNNDLSDFPFDGESTAPLFNKRLHLIPKYVIDRPILEDPPVFIAYEKPSDYAAAWGVAEPSTSKVYEGEPEPKRIVRRRLSFTLETVKSTSEKISPKNGISNSKSNNKRKKLRKETLQSKKAKLYEGNIKLCGLLEF